MPDFKLDPALCSKIADKHEQDVIEAKATMIVIVVHDDGFSWAVRGDMDVAPAILAELAISLDPTFMRAGLIDTRKN